MNILNRLPSYLPIIHLALAVLLTLELGLVSYSTFPLPPPHPPSKQTNPPL